ncbi:MAG: hypothetical protein Q7S66_04255 [bacterium]|nr:hypothetical protein [bacterium]
MPQNLSKEQVNYGQIVYQWDVKEYEQHIRNRRWYVWMGVAAALLILYAIFTANYLFALLLVLFILILALGEMREPLSVPFAITETGIIIGDKYYRFTELVNFWIYYNPPEVKSLYFGFNNLVKHRLQIPLYDYDPRPVREYLSKFLEEDLEQEEEPLSDRIGRLFMLH